MKKEFHILSISDCLDSLRTTDKGLSVSEVKNRIDTYGKNELPQASREATSLRIFFGQFTSPLIIILIIASGISLILGESLDALVIAITVFVNVIVGFVQEYQANQALKKLRNMVSYTATVLRDGEWVRIPSIYVVPGDVMMLVAGDKVQADARILSVSECEVNESVLTGESEPVKKTNTKLSSKKLSVGDRVNMVYRGTVVTKGKATVLVVHTGGHTEIGKIATLVKETKTESTPLQMQITKLSRFLGILVVCMCAGILALGYFSSSDHIDSGVELFKTAIAVAVAAIPEGLAISMTVILAIGMKRVLKRQALVRKLLATETLGSVSVICTDKTGTLTEGNMSVTRVVTSGGIFGAGDLYADMASRSVSEESDARYAIELGVLGNDGVIEHDEKKESEWVISGNMTDTAFIRYGMKLGLRKRELDHVYRRVSEIPFDSDKKYMATLHANGATSFVVVKGAPERLYEQVKKYRKAGELHTWTQKDRAYFYKKEHELTGSGLRVIAVAYKQTFQTKRVLHEKDISELVFVGLVALADPLRSDVPETVEIARKAGIRVIMMTGDHARTAAHIASSAGIGLRDTGGVCEGVEIASMNEAELDQKLSETSVFARVDPSHKIRVVQLLQARGHVVAMTGDGVNDAPALKGADIGVAVGSGTDVAKEIADMVLLNDSFTSIVGAVEEGRGIYQNIKKVVLYLLSNSFAQVVLISASILLGMPLAVLPAQILWVNLIQDSLPVMALAFDKTDKENMKEPPRKKGTPIIDRDMKILITLKTIFANILLVAMFIYFYTSTGDIALTRTIMFIAFAIDTLFYIFPIRSLTRPLIRMQWFDNMYLNFVILFSWGMLIAATYFPPLQTLLSTVPLGMREWVFLVIFGFANLLFVEVVKYFFIQKKNTLQYRES